MRISSGNALIRDLAGRAQSTRRALRQSVNDRGARQNGGGVERHGRGNERGEPDEDGRAAQRSLPSLCLWREPRRAYAQLFTVGCRQRANRRRSCSRRSKLASPLRPARPELRCGAKRSRSPGRGPSSDIARQSFILKQSGATFVVSCMIPLQTCAKVSRIEVGLVF